MPEFDDIDLEILQLLVADARRPYSEIADHVGLSPPAVSDRVERLVDAGVIERFTLDIDRSDIVDGVRVLVDARPDPGATDDVRDGLQAIDDVEHVFVAADGSVVAHALITDGDVRSAIHAGIDPSRVRELEVRLLSESNWTPEVGAAGFGVECTECGATLSDGSRSVRVDGELRHFCDDACRERHEERIERVSEEAT